MKTLTRWAVALVVLVVLAGFGGCTTTRPPNASAATGVGLSPQDEAAVRATLAEFDNTWNHHDLKRMHELFAEEVQWITMAGSLWRDKSAVYNNQDYNHRSNYIPAKLQLRIEDIEVRSLAPQVAVAVAIMNYGKGLIPPGQEIPVWYTRCSFIMAKRGGAWKIAHIQHTVLGHDNRKREREGFIRRESGH